MRRGDFGSSVTLRPRGMADKDVRRKAREAAIRSFNELGAEINLGPIVIRPKADALEPLCERLPEERRGALPTARAQWHDNGGTGNLPENLLLTDAVEEDDGEDVDMCENVPMHGCPRSSPKKPFRLCARAFMLTFNALAFASSARERGAENQDRKQGCLFTACAADGHLGSGFA